MNYVDCFTSALVEDFKRCILSYSLIRTPKACLKSLHYMMDEVLDRKDEDFGQIYSFISDRLRAIFKDLAVQHCKDEFYAEANEISARFRILSDFICKGSEFEKKGSFVTKHNNEKLQESFSNLEHYDNDNPSVNRKNRKETIMLNIAFEIGNGNPSVSDSHEFLQFQCLHV